VTIVEQMRDALGEPQESDESVDESSEVDGALDLLAAFG